MTAPATTSANPAEEGGFTHRQILVIMSGLMLGMFLAALDQTIVSTALPTIVGDFHRSNLLSWVITAYLLASTASTPLWGKAGDLYGRKRVFQLAILVFILSSALCGLSQNMFELIAFRGLQGIGGGGLISLVFAIIGDVIPPRERGRYQGYFGAVFGVASVVGPLAGGFAVDDLTWRYIFYLNLPLGIAALIVTNRVLRLPKRTRHVLIDWWGSLLLVAGVSCILLATQSGGTDYPWGSWQIIGLFGLGALLLAGFAVREKVAPEPILPLDLFRMQIFTVANIVSFVSGVAMFGALAFLPQYLQLVHGVSATESGLLLLPLLIGLLVMSIGSGRYISRTGRYRWFPLAGTIGVTVGLVLLTHLGAHTSLVVVGFYILVFGCGLGLFMQVLTLVVQNAVPMKQMGVATSSVTFFRSMGGAIGASALGAVLTARISYELAHTLPAADLAGGGNKEAEFVQSPDALDALKRTQPALHEIIIQAYSHAIDRLFLVAVPVSILSVIAALFIRQVQLRTSNTNPPAAGDGPSDTATDAVPLAPGGIH
ncbi:MAG: MDR family MFS transporter [Streptosporangiaceae bacterium]|jgi:EmrB/QacA subfamily drug resistance transporter